MNINYEIYEVVYNFIPTQGTLLFKSNSLHRNDLNFIIVAKCNQCSYNIIWYPDEIIEIRSNKQHLATWMRSSDKILSSMGMSEERRKPYREIIRMFYVIKEGIDESQEDKEPEQTQEERNLQSAEPGKYPLKIVEWVDSTISRHTWHYIHEQPKFAAKIVTVGHVVEENDDHITLYGTVSYNLETDEPPEGNGGITIPKGCIKSIKNLWITQDWNADIKPNVDWLSEFEKSMFGEMDVAAEKQIMAGNPTKVAGAETETRMTAFGPMEFYKEPVGKVFDSEKHDPNIPSTQTIDDDAKRKRNGLLDIAAFVVTKDPIINDWLKEYTENKMPFAEFVTKVGDKIEELFKKPSPNA